MKQKILIVSDSLRTGGIQSSLKTFLKYLADDFDIEVFLFNRDGFKPTGLNKNIKVIFGSKLLQTVSCTSDYAKKQGLPTYTLRKIFALLCKLFSSRLMYSFVFMFERKIKNVDTVLSYSNNVSDRSVYFGYNLFAIKKVEAKQKIAYVHSDYSTIHSKYCDWEYSQFDKIWFVSQYTQQIFAKFYHGPQKTYNVIYNFIDNESKNLKNPYKNDLFHIVTVGRLESEKGQIDSIEIAKNLKKENIDFEWYLVGDGVDRLKLEQIIKANDLEKQIIITGYKNNAKDYMKFADICVSLSKKETFGLTIADALNLGTPVVALDLPVLKEVSKGDGIIICNDLRQIVSEIIKLHDNQQYYTKRKKASFIPWNNIGIIDRITKEFKK